VKSEISLDTGTNQIKTEKVFQTQNQHSKPTDPHKAHEALQGKSENFKDCFKSKR